MWILMRWEGVEKDEIDRVAFGFEGCNSNHGIFGSTILSSLGSGLLFSSY